MSRLNPLVFIDFHFSVKFYHCEITGNNEIAAFIFGTTKVRLALPHTKGRHLSRWGPWCPLQWAKGNDKSASAQFSVCFLYFGSNFPFLPGQSTHNKLLRDRPEKASSWIPQSCSRPGLMPDCPVHQSFESKAPIRVPNKESFCTKFHPSKCCRNWFHGECYQTLIFR